MYENLGYEPGAGFGGTWLSEDQAKEVLDMFKNAMDEKDRGLYDWDKILPNARERAPQNKFDNLFK